MMEARRGAGGQLEVVDRILSLNCFNRKLLPWMGVRGRRGVRVVDEDAFKARGTAKQLLLRRMARLLFGL